MGGRWRFLILPYAVIAFAFADRADGADRAAAILSRHCLECHSGSEKEGGLDLTRRESAIAGGESGAALAPGRPDESLLLARVVAGEMPPDDRPKLSGDEVAAIREWLAEGAAWASDPIDPFIYSTDRRAGRDWWSLQPITRPALPGMNDEWVANPIDRFVLEKLSAAGLRGAEVAGRRTLIRRLSFDLSGLPPTPAEVRSYLDDAEPGAYERVVDRLLDSPHFGERMARRWLDVVRFGESQGFERNKLRENAWKYRDWVVWAFNSDLPYDEFIRRQIAGDVLAPDDPLAVIASGFLVAGPYDLTAYTTGVKEMQLAAREEELEGLMATVCQTFLGLTVNCARCHDHKFDPISQREYYQLSAALGGVYHGDERESLSEAARVAAAERAASASEPAARLLAGGPTHVPVPQQPPAWRVLARGDFRSPQETVSPGGVAALTGVSAEWGLAEDAPEAERRKTLANWIADANNPLAPRVIVNRLWSYYFGEGLVRTPSDFGFQGGQASHPELLDWLASELVAPQEGALWRLKRIHRLIVTSATYRQASRSNEQAAAIDTDNRLLWKNPMSRLDAESFRDAVLAVSGVLDRSLGGPGFRDFTVTSAGNNERYAVFDGLGGDFKRRTLYRTTVRAGGNPLLDILDCPDPSVATPQRVATSTPLQALSLLSDKFTEHHAQRFAQRLHREAGEDVSAQIELAYELAFSRPPDSDEIEFARNHIERSSLAEFCLAVFNANEFLFVE